MMESSIIHRINDMDDIVEGSIIDAALNSVGRTAPRTRGPKKPTSEEMKMSRMTYDGLLLQSQLCFEEIRAISDIAQTLFCREGEEAGKVAMNRARSAAMNLVTMHHAKAIPSRKNMTHIQSTSSCGTQLAALMNINTRRAEQMRTEDRRKAKEDADSLVIETSQTQTQV